MYIILVIIIYSHNCFDAIMTKIQSKKVITTKKSVEASNILNLSKVELKGDILNRTDIEKLVDIFYRELLNDKRLSIFFKEILSVEMEQHKIKMSDFWENILFYTGNFEGNPILTHRKIYHLKKVTAQTFKVWLNLFDNVVDSLFIGENAELIKLRAKNIAETMLNYMKEKK